MKQKEPVLHIRTNFSGKWIWELRSSDGHVVNMSEGFDARAQCENDARAHGFAVAPKRVRAHQITLSIVPLREQFGLWSVFEDESGLWRWERGANGDEGDQGRCAFLTRRECLDDARKHGCTIEYGDQDELKTD